MSYDVPPPRRPISGLRISAVALLGVVTAVGVPAVAAAIAVSVPVGDEHARTEVSTGNGTTDEENPQDPRSADVIVISTTNGKVSVK